jgi:hypothetical protein
MRFWPQSREDQVVDHFAFLLKRRYALVARSSSGNSGRVTYRSAKMWIGIEWDGGDPWIDFSPVGASDSYDWDLVRLFMRGRTEYESRDLSVRTDKVPMLAAFARTHLAAIEALFAPTVRDGTVAALSALKADRSAKLRARSSVKKPKRASPTLQPRTT